LTHENNCPLAVHFVGAGDRPFRSPPVSILGCSFDGPLAPLGHNLERLCHRSGRVGDLAGWPVFPRRMAMVNIKKRETIPGADNRLAKARARGITARRKLMEADGASLSSATTAPQSRITTREHISTTSSQSCVAMSLVSGICRSRVLNSRWSRGYKSVVGSSSARISGLHSSTPAKQKRGFSP